jgi:hypothetical protein
VKGRIALSGCNKAKGCNDSLFGVYCMITSL